MKLPRRSFLSRALALFGLGAVAPVIAAKASPWYGKGFYDRLPTSGPWELLRWTVCEHVDGYGVSLVMEIAAEGRPNRLVVADCRHGDGWEDRDYRQLLAQMKFGLLDQLQSLNDLELMALYA